MRLVFLCELSAFAGGLLNARIKPIPRKDAKLARE
jgi:hypothetical protein